MDVCMICTANTCRSPMAEVLMRQALKERGNEDVAVHSFGIFAPEGLPASAEAVEVMEEMGLSIKNHRARSVSSAPKDALFLCMTRSHVRAVKDALPGARAELFLEYAGLSGEVSDPYGRGLTAYRIAVSKMESAAASAAERILLEGVKGE